MKNNIEQNAIAIHNDILCNLGMGRILYFDKELLKNV
jgi:hypothetical protein